MRSCDGTFCFERGRDEIVPETRRESAHRKRRPTRNTRRIGVEDVLSDAHTSIRSLSRDARTRNVALSKHGRNACCTTSRSRLAMACDGSRRAILWRPEAIRTMRGPRSDRTLRWRGVPIVSAALDVEVRDGAREEPHLGPPWRRNVESASMAEKRPSFRPKNQILPTLRSDDEGTPCKTLPTAAASWIRSKVGFPTVASFSTAGWSAFAWRSYVRILCRRFGSYDPFRSMGRSDRGGVDGSSSCIATFQVLLSNIETNPNPGMER